MNYEELTDQVAAQLFVAITAQEGATGHDVQGTARRRARMAYDHAREFVNERRDVDRIRSEMREPMVRPRGPRADR